MAREINLVPDIKGEMIKTLKLRNFVLFVCLIVIAASVGITIVLAVIMGGQQLAIDGKKDVLDLYSEKVNSYSDLNKFLTIKDQLGNIATLTENKTVSSRTFNIIPALIPTGPDTIRISSLNIDLSPDESEGVLYSIEAQANAGKEPFIDYNVLDAFKKSMQFMRYDFGEYVDRENNTIPAYCMIERGSDGATFNDPERGFYAYWLIDLEGCNESKSTGYSTEDYNGNQVVRIWRTPQFGDWYKQTAVENQPYMNLSGEITGVEHFRSACITYTGNDSTNKISPTWTENNICLLVPNGTDGFIITDSSNGKDENEELVLRFSAVIQLDPQVYNFNNTHMLALAPAGRRNVTDSFVQVQAVFGKRAEDCAKDDTACTSTNQTIEEKDTKEETGGNNG